MENRLSLRVNVIGRKGRVIELQIYFTSTIGRDISQFIYGTATLVRPKKYRDPVSRLVYTRTSNRETRCTIYGRTESRGPLSNGILSAIYNNLSIPTFEISEKRIWEINVTQ